MNYLTLARNAAACVAIAGLATALATSAPAARQSPPAGPESRRPASDKAGLEGTVVSSGTGQPLRNARVTLRRADAAGEDALEWNPVAIAIPAQAALRGGIGGAARGFTGAGLPAANNLSTLTDAMGHFSLPEVMPAEYRVTAEGEGHVRQEYGQRTVMGPGTAVSAAAGKRLTLDFRLTPASVISGRVFDPEGEALIKTPVQAYTYRYTNGKRTLTPVASAETNDLGEYRLYWIQPGEYFIAAMPRGGFSGTSVPSTGGAPAAGARNAQFFAVAGNGQATVVQLAAPAGGADAIYYPGVANPADATLIRIAPATDVPNIDFHLRPLRTIRVTGRIIAPFSLAPIELSPAGPPRPAGETAPDKPASEKNASGPEVNAQAGILVGRGGPPRVAGRFTTFDGETGIVGARVELTLRRAGSAESALGPFGSAPTPVRPDGTFEIPNVTPGSYVLTAITRDPAGLQHTARATIEAGIDDIRDLVIPLQPGNDARGRILIDPPAPDSFKMTNLEVSLVPEDSPMLPPPPPGGDFVQAVRSPGGVFPGGDTITAKVEEDGSFVLKDVGAALEYRVRVSGISGGAYLVKGLFGSTDALGAPFTGGDPNASMQLQIGFSAGSVSGTVLDAGGKPYAAAVVALVPDKARSGRTDLYFSTTSGSDGSYAFSSVPPGAYRLFAWAEIPSEAFRYADFLKDYEDRAQSGAVDKRGVWTATLKVIPPADQ